MKNIYLTGAFILIFFTGCSSTYKVTDFPAKEKFYEELNNSFKDKEAKITMINDSVLITHAGVEIENDTLYSIVHLEEKQNSRLALTDIENINYRGNDFTSALILSKDGTEFKAEKVKVLHDSVNFIEVRDVRAKNIITSIDNVRNVSYKNLWLRIPSGIFGGGTIGLMISANILVSNNNSFLVGGFQPYGIAGFVIGALIGGSIGYFFGYDELYQFKE